MPDIFESPDGGKTVYARESGSTTRRKVRGDNDLHKRMMEDQLWGNIRRAAKDNPALQESLERVKVIYYLSNEHSSRHNR